MATYDVACCYFPTTVLFVDDKQGYLEQMEMDLDENIACKFCTDTRQALSFLKQGDHINSYIKKWSQSLKSTDIELGAKLEEQEQTHSYIDIDIAAIHQQIYNPERFQEISLIVIDYSMPQMNGIEFCKQLKGLPIKKLMLTGQAGHEIGVQALNDGIIDKFVIKCSDVFNNQFNTMLSELRHSYFQDASDAIIQHLVTSPYCCLGDKVFIEKFIELRKVHNIIEYYLVKDNGCFLMLDIDGNPSWLAVKTESEMQDDYQVAYDNKTPAGVLDALQKRRQLMFHITTDDLADYFNSNWREYLYPATALQGDNGKIYYSLISGTHKYDINNSAIAPYKAFLHTL